MQHHFSVEGSVRVLISMVNVCFGMEVHFQGCFISVPGLGHRDRVKLVGDRLKHVVEGKLAVDRSAQNAVLEGWEGMEECH